MKAFIQSHRGIQWKPNRQQYISPFLVTMHNNYYLLRFSGSPSSRGYDNYLQRHYIIMSMRRCVCRAVKLFDWAKTYARLLKKKKTPFGGISGWFAPYVARTFARTYTSINWDGVGDCELFASILFKVCLTPVLFRGPYFSDYMLQQRRPRRINAVTWRRESRRYIINLAHLKVHSLRYGEVSAYNNNWRRIIRFHGGGRKEEKQHFLAPTHVFYASTVNSYCRPKSVYPRTVCVLLLQQLATGR